MITCYLRYELDPDQIEAFAEYGRRWITLVNRHGGRHHGYFIPHEGANDIGYALFSFPSLAEYEAYRQRIASDPDCLAALRLARETGCIRRYDRSFLKPLTEGATEAELALSRDPEAG